MTWYQLTLPRKGLKGHYRRLDGFSAATLRGAEDWKPREVVPNTSLESTIPSIHIPAWAKILEI